MTENGPDQIILRLLRNMDQQIDGLRDDMREVKKVYLVQADWADENWVRAICETKEEAEAMAATPVPNDPTTTQYTVEEWELGKSRNQQGD